ncbi:MAG: hypothetical protein HDS36_06160 [Bacteroides sp.]|nr:hypothetical protein [Bacteroides sp.]
MKKSILFLFISLLLLAGCTKPRFTVEFQLPAELHAAYTLSYYASSSTQGRWIETGVMLQGGKSKTVLPISNPAVVALSAAGNTIHFYAEKGDKIEIQGESADIFSWKIGGNGINDNWSKWRNENTSALGSRDAAKINEAVRKFVEKNNENPLSALLLLYDFDRRADNPLFLKLWKMLKGEAAKEKWISLSGRSDLYTNTPLDAPDPKKKHMIALKSLGNGADTIITGKVPVVLLFWRNSDAERGEMIDSLKALRKAHPDSASFIIADICFDPDSISWASPLGRDSLEHTIRAWNPVAEADSAIRALGIERTPTLITISPIR